MSSRASLENTATLLALARDGDGRAREKLFGRYLTMLRQWAHHRRPGGIHNLSETDDLVQETLLRAFQHLDSFEYQKEGAFLAYLRQIMMNAIRDTARRDAVRPRPVTLGESAPDRIASPLEEAIGQDSLERIEAGLAKLDPEPRQAVILRIEFGLSHQEIAAALGKPSADAARMTVARALVDLTKAMRDGRESPRA
ncbi:MAG: sigma-70 family RNA polymerase sigma factor [Candidatus Eisenbacteria bacterium]|uniref:Sigma-70 family RNA polymerase sigma factor n=1 Tax=Eiseniibacteriota bacterium TaxID=2212470 RepID=A0A956LYN1_UNCEI|nr:sigma-70 family RNA polymerase sigma factor [Candidatus Eisenbacteria bacterium]